MANPVINLQNGSSGPPVQPGYVPRAITLDDVLSKSLMSFAVVIASGAAAAILTPVHLLLPVALTVGLLALLLTIGGWTLSRGNPGAGIVMTYSVLQGVFIGAFSMVLNNQFPGIASTAVIATIVTATAIVAGTRVGLLRTTPKLRRMFSFALIGYVGFLLVALLLSFVGIAIMPFGSGLSLIVSVFGVAMATFSLVMDVEDIQSAVSSGASERNAWGLAWGLVVSLIWLYVEILTLLADLYADD